MLNIKLPHNTNMGACEVFYYVDRLFENLTGPT